MRLLPGFPKLHDPHFHDLMSSPLPQPVQSPILYGKNALRSILNHDLKPTYTQSRPSGACRHFNFGKQGPQINYLYPANLSLASSTSGRPG